MHNCAPYLLTCVVLRTTYKPQPQRKDGKNINNNMRILSTLLVYY